MRALTTPTPAGRCFSAAVCSDGAYGIERGVIFSFPLRSDGWDWSVVPGLPVDEFGRARLAASANELKEEKALVTELLGA